MPRSLRGSRFALYFEKQIQYWDDTPTYPFDEWSAYIGGAECAVDDYKNMLVEKTDCVSGSLEFSIYCLAVGIATKELDPIYWNKGQMKDIIKYFLIRSEKVFFDGKDKFPFKQQDILLNNLRNKEDSVSLRSFLIDEFDGIFIK